MNELFTKRRHNHFLMLLKYWRLVFNDHFVIALFFMFGALAYWYSQILAKIPPKNIWVQLVLAIFMTLVAQLGRLATLVKKADPIFLLPQASAMQGYFRRSYGYSWILAVIISLVGIIIALPLAMVTYKMSQLNVLVIVVSTILIKTGWLYLAQLVLTSDEKQEGWLHLLQWGLPLIGWLLTWLINPLFGALFDLVWCACSGWLASIHKEFDWRRVVKYEQDRMASVYRFFNLFTDVPNMQGQVKRRSYLNFILRKLGQNTVWEYLYGRGFIRNTEISNLILRLTILGMVILVFVPVTWLNSVFLALFLYLITAQLVPLYDQYANNAFTYIYPLTRHDQTIAFIKVVRKVMMAVAILLVIASVGTRLSWQQVVINLVISVIMLPVLTKQYVEYRIKKL